MNILLDTHILLWTLTGDSRLPGTAAGMIDDFEKNTIFYSIASIWETEIKNSLGKLPVSGRELSDYCRQAEFELLPIEEKHIFTLSSLKRDSALPKHNDPFDRIMLAQAKAEGYQFLTHDVLITGYQENCVIFV